ncbi:MAG: NIL domain-containing protein [Planctomycetota bacterium]|jgi:ABC-type methionine transport system ATPase subunit
MTSESQKATRFKMTFPEKVLGEPIMHKLSHDLDVVPNILRGRITESSAWLEVELVGSQSSIEEAIEFLGGLGVTVESVAD